MDTKNDWDEGVPFVLFAAREVVQESTGFSPAELIFGHTVRGPLKFLKEQVLDTSSPPKHVLEYVSAVRERLHSARALAAEMLLTTQGRMKARFDRKAVYRSLQPGDRVLVLLPVPGSSLSARFVGPYKVERKLSETDYVIKTPDRKRQSRVCHVNMLKLYHSRDDSPNATAVPAVSSVAAVVLSQSANNAPVDDEDGLSPRMASAQLSARLANSELLPNLPALLVHLCGEQQADIVKLVDAFPSMW